MIGVISDNLTFEGVRDAKPLIFIEPCVTQIDFNCYLLKGTLTIPWCQPEQIWLVMMTHLAQEILQVDSQIKSQKLEEGRWQTELVHQTQPLLKNSGQ